MSRYSRLDSWKFDDVKTSTFALQASQAEIIVLRTSNSRGALSYQPVVPRRTTTIPYTIVYHRFR